jgi:hypothetical protein
MSDPNGFYKVSIREPLLQESDIVSQRLSGV